MYVNMYVYILSGMFAQVNSLFLASNVDMKKWRIVDSRTFGIDRSMVPPSSLTVLRILRNQGRVLSMFNWITIFMIIALLILS